MKGIQEESILGNQIIKEILKEYSPHSINYV